MSRFSGLCFCTVVDWILIFALCCEEGLVLIDYSLDIDHS